MQTKQQTSTQSSKKHPTDNKAMNVAGEDRAGKTKTIYQVSGFEIFWRNFLAGFARALGIMVLYIIIIIISGVIFTTTFLPMINPSLQNAQELIENINNNL